MWIYRNQQTREAVIAFRGTSNPQDMMTDAALAMSAFSPGHRSGGSKSPDDVAAELSDEEVLQGPLGGIFASIKVCWQYVMPLLVLCDSVKVFVESCMGRAIIVQVDPQEPLYAS